MNKRLKWIIELIIWLIAICAISFFILFFRSVEDQKKHSYYLFFNDIDGLMQGCPVRLMGMKIGYVQEIKVFDNKVFVSFLVTENRVKLPEPALATVEFYGLGGSKSLEIMPIGDSYVGREGLISIKEPYRIQKFYDVQNNIARTIVFMGNSFDQFVQESDIYEYKELLKMSTKVKEANCLLEKFSKLINDLEINKKTDGGKDIVNNENVSE